MGPLWKLWLLATALLLLISRTNVLAAPATFTTIDYPGSLSTYALGINSQGDIAGAWDDALTEHAFVFIAPRNSAAQKTAYDTLCAGGLDALQNGNASARGCFVSFDYTSEGFTAPWTQAWGITPQGEIVGQYGLADGTTHGFLLRNGQFFAVDVEGWPNTMPAKISPSGMIVGCNHITFIPQMHGFAITGAGVTHDPDGGTMYNGVNPQGDILGIYYDPPQKWVTVKTFVIHNGEKTFLPSPEGALAMVGQDINAAGDVVGRYKDSAGEIHGFLLLRDGTFSTIDPEGTIQTNVSGINARGDIVGYYIDSTWTGHAFLMTQ